mmetsp:Transcript_16519/g.56181  ORF Transcript_16519/g.56181 Transcript_16519/m.56181 type:complete len:234 (-) Transcript_16519:553-1254(-)
MTVSPSSRKTRVEPSASATGCSPFQDSSSMEPYVPGSLPLMVPLPMRSPGRRLQPVTVWCTSCCRGVQYRLRRLLLPTTLASPPAGWSDTSRCTSYEEYVGSRRYSRGSGSCTPADVGARKGSSAAMGTTQGLMVVRKFFDPKGPSGTYSQRCTSRALQSFSSTMPKMWRSASSMATGRPRSEPMPTKKPTSSSKSRRAVGRCPGWSQPPGSTWPAGRVGPAGDARTEEARPW